MSTIPTSFFDDNGTFKCPICLSNDHPPAVTPGTIIKLYNPSSNTIYKTSKASCDRFHPICKGCYDNPELNLKTLSTCCICRKPQNCLLPLEKEKTSLKNEKITPDTAFKTKEITQIQFISNLRLQGIAKIIQELHSKELLNLFFEKNQEIIFNKINFFINTNKKSFFQLVRSFFQETIDLIDANPFYLKYQINILMRFITIYKINKCFAPAYNTLKEALAITNKVTNNEDQLTILEIISDNFISIIEEKQNQKYNQERDNNPPNNIMHIQKINDSPELIFIKNRLTEITKKMELLNNAIFTANKNPVFFLSTNRKIEEIFNKIFKLEELKITSIPKMEYILRQNYFRLY
jgi:hypothetical protein